ncbi:MAG TPA: efflux transporter periplasmic adaptor subunit [Verrucomicrobia bacterium]|nr:MAG: hypothetical protein A2X46_17945 [Lentisphaerae bacterium GWF2_57_35]HBA86377.1 efflux transporter periplasmic adaptor subunit [Verrucomicrobiota bacterium]
MKKIWIGIIALVLLGSIGWRVWQKVEEARGRERRGGARPVPVVVEPVRREAIRDVSEFTGTLLPRAQFMAAPKIPGRLERLLVHIGDVVTNGTLIAVLDSEEYEQQVLQARAELDVGRAMLAEARSALNIAGRELQRVKELRVQQVASEAELDEADSRHRAAQAKVQVAEAQIEQRAAALRTAEVRLSYSRIHVSWENGDGRRLISERFVDEGALLKANDAIVSVVDVDVVLAVIYVIEQDFPEIRLGQEAEIFTDAYPGRAFSGRVVRRAPVLREETRQARVEIELPNEERLLAPGMFVRARIQFAQSEQAQVIPITALVRRNEQQGVFAADLETKKARFVPVRLGIVSADSAEVLEPALDGLVVTIGQHLLSDGAAIALPAPAGSQGKQP